MGVKLTPGRVGIDFYPLSTIGQSVHHRHNLSPIGFISTDRALPSMSPSISVGRSALPAKPSQPTCATRCLSRTKKCEMG